MPVVTGTGTGTPGGAPGPDYRSPRQVYKCRPRHCNGCGQIGNWQSSGLGQGARRPGRRPGSGRGKGCLKSMGTLQRSNPRVTQLYQRQAARVSSTATMGALRWHHTAIRAMFVVATSHRERRASNNNLRGRERTLTAVADGHSQLLPS